MDSSGRTDAWYVGVANQVGVELFTGTQPLDTTATLPRLFDDCVAVARSMPDEPEWFHEIDHTGDVGLRITAPTLPELFERAAHGMFRVLTDLDTVRPVQSRPITVEGRDREALMVQWLSELNYRHTVDRVLYRTFEVQALDADDATIRLTATVRGEPIDASRHPVYTEIKAVTFHGLDVQATDDGWGVQVIFDM